MVADVSVQGQLGAQLGASTPPVGGPLGLGTSTRAPTMDDDEFSKENLSDSVFQRAMKAGQVGRWWLARQAWAKRLGQHSRGIVRTIRHIKKDIQALETEVPFYVRGAQRRT